MRRSQGGIVQLNGHFLRGPGRPKERISRKPCIYMAGCISPICHFFSVWISPTLGAKALHLTPKKLGPRKCRNPVDSLADCSISAECVAAQGESDPTTTTRGTSDAEATHDHSEAGSAGRRLKAALKCYQRGSHQHPEGTTAPMPGLRDRAAPTRAPVFKHLFAIRSRL